MGSKFPTSPAFNTLSFNSWFRKHRFCTQGPQLSSCTLSDHWLLLIHSAVSDSLWLHGLQHPKLPCSSPSPRVCSNSCPLSQWCHPTILSSLLLPSIFPSIRVFSNELALCIRWPKYWRFSFSFSFSIGASDEYSGLISFRIDWFHLLAVQGTIKSLLQHCNSKASILWQSAFFMVQLISVHDYWRNQSFDYMNLCLQSDISVFSYAA